MEILIFDENLICPPRLFGYEAAANWSANSLPNVTH